MKELIKKIENIEEEMKKTSHFFSENDKNPYHLENDVFTHTQMVMREAEILDKNNEILNLACKMHDTGKVFAKRENPEKRRVSFQGHEGISFYITNSLINHLQNRKNISKLVALHDLAYKRINEFLSLNSFEEFVNSFFFSFNLDDYENLLKLIYCDMKGRLVTEEIEKKNKKILSKIEFLLSTKEKNIEIKREKNKNKPNLYILIGVQNSGKSTFIKNSFPSNVPIISRDEILMETVKEHSKTNLNYTQAFEYASEKNLHPEINQKLNKTISRFRRFDNDIVIDMMNLTLKSRRSIFNQYKKNFNIVYVMFYTPITEILIRNQKRKEISGKFIHPDIILNSMKSLQYPVNEPFTHIIEK